MKLLLISGSLRKASYNSAIIDFIAHYYAKSNKIIPMVFSNLDQLPIYNPDLDSHDLKSDNSPQEVQKFRQIVKETDAVLIATPEYAYEIPGGLKNALDWLVSSGEFVEKPVSILSSSTSDMGGQSAYEVLAKLTAVLNAKNPHQQPLCIEHINKKIIEGNIDNVLQSLIMKRVEELYAFINDSNEKGV